MKYKIRNLVTNVFGWVALILVVFFFFTMWLFNYNGVEQPLQNAWGLSVSVLSGLATLAAAYIAALLFNDWRVQADYESKKEHIERAINDLNDLRISLVGLREHISHLEAHSQNKPFDFYHYFDLINNKITKYYYSQQRLERLLKISFDNPLFTTMEEIMKEYMKLLVYNDNFQLDSFNRDESKLIKELIANYPQFLDFLYNQVNPSNSN